MGGSSFRIALAALVLAAVGAASCGRSPTPPAPADPATRRSLPAGDVVGIEGRYGSHAWLGIPYAEPPVGPLRWRAPRPAPRWSGTRTASTFGSPCSQLASPLGGATDAEPGTLVGSEDCLTLAVWSPRFPTGAVPRGDARLPVMVWIHGGGNVVGHAGFYDGGNLAVRGDVIVVALNYRLGPFGWFRHASLRGEGTTAEDRSGNFGTLDLIRGLEWVRDNIAAFGGDPDNVTIFGESAGGRNVVTLLLAPGARGLFHRAIVQSGGTGTTPPAKGENFADADEPGDAASSNEVLLTLLVQDGTAPDRATARARLAAMEDAEVAAYLRGKSNGEILGAYGKDEIEGLVDLPQIFADGAVLPSGEALDWLARPGGSNPVPVILGTNRDENKLFLALDRSRVTWWLGLLPRARDPEHYELSAEYLSRIWKATGADEPATALASARAPGVYVYRFDWDEEPTVLFVSDLSQLLGAAHAFEIPFVFGHWNLGPEGERIFSAANRPGRETLSEQMSSYWAEFAAAGAPDRGRDGSLPEWTAWSGASPRFLVFDTPEDGGLRMESGALTEAGVLRAVDEDPRLPTQRDRCRIFRELADWGRSLTRESYVNAGRLGCADYPFDAYPWGG